MTKVYLAVGHGHRDNGTFDPGAVGNGWDEQVAGDIVVAVAAKLLRDAGLDVRDEANRDDPNFPGTTRQANAWGADLLVSVHHDWIGAPEGAFGHWVSSGGKEAADHIQQAVGSAGFPLRPSWHKRRTDLYVLNNTDMPAVLYECGRIGQNDLDTVGELERMGAAIAAGIAAWAGIEMEQDMAGVETKVDRILEILGERDERPSMWRDLDRTKQAAGRTEQVLAELPGKVAAAVADVIPNIVIDAEAVADVVIAEVARAIQSTVEGLE